MTDWRFYNTLTRQTEPLQPLKPGQVSLYTCGPTVYLEPHIGNWRTFIFYDTLARALQFDGLKVNHVLNITDVGHLTSDADEGEDKLVAEAKIERKTAWAVAKEYTDLFEQGMKRLNILPPTHTPKATDHIPAQIELIKTLESKGATYKLDDGVYFDTAKFANYGKLSGANRENQLAGARVQTHSGKHHHTDFALWKFSPAGGNRDMEWDSPWGKGFPGWHLECSALALEYLGPTIDIHAGGVDHIGTHHTNEIAQSQTATGQPLANLWLHAEHMMVDDHKMSKSLGNTYLLDAIAKKADLMAFRLLVLSAHYRTQQNFTWEALAASQRFLGELQAWADLKHQPAVGEPMDQMAAKRLRQELLSALGDDLDTPRAIAQISEFMNRQAPPTQAVLDDLDEVLGLNLAQGPDIDPEIKQLIAQRETARQAKNFAESDSLRDKLHQHQVEIEDTPTGPRWRRI